MLFSEYICLAIMSFPYSYSVLGLVPGLILTVVVAALVLYTSLVLWEFCLRHPEVRDVCDIGQMLFWGKTWAWYATAVMFVLNNTFIQVRQDLAASAINLIIFRACTCLSVQNISIQSPTIASVPLFSPSLQPLFAGSALFRGLSMRFPNWDPDLRSSHSFQSYWQLYLRELKHIRTATTQIPTMSIQSRESTVERR